MTNLSFALEITDPQADTTLGPFSLTPLGQQCDKSEIRSLAESVLRHNSRATRIDLVIDRHHATAIMTRSDTGFLGVIEVGIDPSFRYDMFRESDVTIYMVIDCKHHTVTPWQTLGSVHDSVRSAVLRSYDHDVNRHDARRKVDVDGVLIDEGIADVVRAAHNLGWDIVSSCQGHESSEAEPAHLMFTDCDDAMTAFSLLLPLMRGTCEDDREVSLTVMGPCTNENCSCPLSDYENIMLSWNHPSVNPSFANLLALYERGTR